jgi:hypothetical protein
MSRWGILSGSGTSDGISAPGRPGIGVRIHYVAPRFFETIGFSLRAGRDVAATDREGAPRVVVINEAVAKRLLPGVAAVGQELRFNEASVQVVGWSRTPATRACAARRRRRSMSRSGRTPSTR